MEMMDMAADDTREELRRKLRSNFDGRIVRKDLTKKIKEGANVPVYVLEFLLGQYCSSDDETIIEQGVQNVKRILAPAAFLIFFDAKTPGNKYSGCFYKRRQPDLNW